LLRDVLRPIKASVATSTAFSNWLERAFLWLVISVQLLFSAMVFLPLFIDTNHNDVGGDAHFM
jgi:hypothetical protein